LALDGRKKSGRQEVFLAEKWEKRQKKKAKKNPKTEKLKRKPMAGQSVFLSRGQSALSVLRCLADLLPGQFRCKCISAGSTGLSNSCQVPLKILTPASLLNYLFLLTVCKLLLMWVELLITQQGGSQSGEKSQQFIWL